MFTKDKIKSNDLRVQKTKKIIKESFFELVEEKGYAKVTVMDITKKAMINRNTFYLHYVDKEDLIDQILNDNFNSHLPFLKNIIDSGYLIAAQNSIEVLYKIFKETCLLIKEEIDLYRIIVLDPGLIGYFNKLKFYIKKEINTFSDLPLEKQLLFDYVYEGLFVVLVQWIIKQFASVDEMAHLMISLIEQDYKRILSN